MYGILSDFDHMIAKGTKHHVRIILGWSEVWSGTKSISTMRNSRTLTGAIPRTRLTC